jgi:hypothetical protein
MEQENSFIEENKETAFSFTSEDFIEYVQLAITENKATDLQEYLNHLPINFENKIAINHFYSFLKKLKEDDLKAFLGLLLSIKIENKLLTNIITKGTIKLLQQTSSSVLLLGLLRFLLQFKDLKILNDKYIGKIAKSLYKSMSKNKELQSEFLKLVTENKKKLIYVYFTGNMLKYDLDIKKDLENLFVSFYEDEILVDEERDKQLAKQRFLNKYLKYVNQDLIRDKVIPGIENLILRSSQNIKFLENFFTDYESKFEDGFVAKLLDRFESYFFNEKTYDSALASFSRICEYSSNVRLILNNLLNTEFSADKVDLNINTCFYLTYVLGIKDAKLTKSEAIMIANFILKTLEIQNEKNKPTFEKILESLVIGLIKAVPQDSALSKELDTHLQLIKKILSTSSYSYYFQYVHMIMSVLIEKCSVDYPKNIYEGLFNNINNLTLTVTNLKNFIAQTALCFKLAGNENTFNTYKKNLNNALQQIINPDNLNLFSNPSSFDFVNIIAIYNSITSDKEKQEFFEEELTSLSRLVSTTLFRKDKKDFETVVYKNTLSQITEKSIFDVLIDSVFIYTINNPNGLYFQKIKILLKKYSEFYNTFDSVEFIKFIILSHIPNVNNNIATNKITKNGFLNDLYKKYHKLESNNDIIILLEENYDSLATFIFSDLGLFNKSNYYLSASCLNIVTKMFANPSLATFVIKSIINCTDVRKFLFVDEVIKFYNKQAEYISFYDMAYLIETIQNLEKEYINSNSGKDSNQQSEKNIVAVAGKKPTGKQQQITNKGAKNQKTTQQPQEKVDKDAKLIEYKNYLDKYLVNLNLHSNFIMTRLNGVFRLTNSEIQRFNLQMLLKHLWKLLKVEHINKTLRTYLHELMQDNHLLNQFSIELPNLMHMQANPHDFDNTIEIHPSTVIIFNEKLEKALNHQDDYLTSLFEQFDFVIIKLLFYIILNKHISNDDKSSSVNILINIIKNLNKNILNFSEIGILCNSLLKTSYNSENLSVFLEIFLKTCKEEHFLSLCSDILEYEYIAKVSFLEQILEQKLCSLRKYRNLVYKIWILIFDENDNISNLALNIWNTFQLYLDNDFVKSDEFAIALTTHREAYSVNSAIRAYSFIIPKECKNILLKYQEFYEKELDLLQDENFDEDTVGKSRILLFDYINETIELFTSDMKKSILDFIMHISDKEFNEELFELMNSTIYNIISNIDDTNLFADILNSIENNLKTTLNKKASDINTKNLKIIMMTLNSILRKNDDYEKTIIKKSTSETLFNSLLTLAEKLTGTDILCLIAICFQYLAKDNQEKSTEIINSTITKFKTENKSLFNVGQLYVMAGLIKFFGINTYKVYNIHEMILENMKKNKSSVEKQNAIILVKVLSDAQKRLYEPYLVSIFDNICELIADRDDKVRETTQNAIKSFMKIQSGYGVKIIMPRLIKDLHTMNWRSKVVNIEILGQFAFCAPKQLSIYIPKVIKEIMTVFKDPHEKVQETAIAVLKDISSVIKNPEIVDLSDLLIAAVSNPFEHSKNALTAVLETTFKHAIDPPSLALVIPIIDYNLKTQNQELKKKAAHVIGSIANLVKNPIDIYQYIDIILPSLKSALFDSIPECRNSTAKAIGSLTKVF